MLLLNGDGTVRSHQKISDTEGGFEFKKGILTIESDTAVLIVTATDAAGNVSECMVDLCSTDDVDGAGRANVTGLR